MRVGFSGNSHLIIKPNATVRLSGVLTSATACSEDIWQGVEVWGNQSIVSQYSIHGVRGQGRLFGRLGAMIENAETAVKLYSPQDFRGTGGQIYCTGTIFKNNVKGIEFAPFQNTLAGNH